MILRSCDVSANPIARQETPALTALGSTGCALTNLSCICKDTSFLQSLEPAVQAACSPADLASAFGPTPPCHCAREEYANPRLPAALQFAVTLCEGVGVTLTIAPPSATGAPTSTAPATTAPATTVAVTTTAPATTAPAVTTSSSSSAVSSLSTVTTVPSVTVTPVVSQITDGQPQGPTATPTVTPFKGAAAGMANGGMLAGVVAAVGVLAAL